MDRANVEIVNDRDAIDAVRDHLVEAMERHGYPPASVFAVRLAYEECIINAFHHGHAGLPADTRARVEYTVDEERVTLAIEDRGPGFSPGAVPDPTLPENIESPGGRGLLLIRAYMSEVAFNEAGNRVMLVYRRPKGTAAP